MSALDNLSGLNYEANDGSSFVGSIQIGINSMSRIVISDSLSVAFKILVNGSSVEEKVGVWLGHLTLSLSVSLESKVELLDVLVVDKEVCKVGIAEDIYTERSKSQIRLIERTINCTDLFGQLKMKATYTKIVNHAC